MSTRVSSLAQSDLWQRAGLSYVQTTPGTDLSTAVADAWEPPHPLAVPADLCNEILERAKALPAVPVHSFGEVHLLGRYPDSGSAADPIRNAAVTRMHGPLQLPVEVAEQLIQRMEAANAAWWGLDVTHWTFLAKRYPTGAFHPTHTDWDPNGQGGKLTGSVQLTPGEDYDGGELYHQRVTGAQFPKMPKAQGTLIVFPSWTMHGVHPVTRGERWVLLIDGWGPRLQ